MENAASFHYCISSHFLFLYTPRRQNIWKNIYEINNPCVVLQSSAMPGGSTGASQQEGNGTMAAGNEESQW